MSTAAAPTTRRASMNVLAICSVVLGLLATVSTVGLGIPALAAFAVGAGHMALRQIEQRAQRGRRVALVGLILGYGVAVWAVVASLRYLPALLGAG